MVKAGSSGNQQAFLLYLTMLFSHSHSPLSLKPKRKLLRRAKLFFDVYQRKNVPSGFMQSLLLALKLSFFSQPFKDAMAIHYNS